MTEEEKSKKINSFNHICLKEIAQNSYHQYSNLYHLIVCSPFLYYHKLKDLNYKKVEYNHWKI